MRVSRESSRILKPQYEGTPPSTTTSVSLTVFDTVTFDTHLAVIYAYRPPTPPNSVIEFGLRKVLAEYREFAGRLGRDSKGKQVILLNDEGIKFVEATVDCSLQQVLPFKPSSSLLNLHPTLRDVEELVQVQLNRFTCGSLVVGFTSHHYVADGHSTSNFLMAWGQACRGVDIYPLPLHDRSIFVPRDPPIYQYEHRGVEFIDKSQKKVTFTDIDDIVVHKTHFTVEFLRKVKEKASIGSNTSYSTFESLLAHLWRSITKARGLNGFEISQVRISVNGRTRMNPQVPNEYLGNVVLWSFPRARVKDLVNEPLQYAAKILHDAIVKVDDDYYKSFIDFASTKVEEEGLVPTADMKKSVLCPNVDVDSWLRFPFYDLDFGGGSAFIFTPSFYPTEGLLFLLPSFIGDGSIDAFVPLFSQNLAAFKKICYSLD